MAPAQCLAHTGGGGGREVARSERAGGLGSSERGRRAGR